MMKTALYVVFVAVLCGMYQDKQTINLKSQSAIISLTSRMRKRMKCHLELRLSSEYFGFSVFIESMKLDNTTGCSKDFLQFGRYVIYTCCIPFMHFHISEILLFSHLSRVTEGVAQQSHHSGYYEMMDHCSRLIMERVLYSRGSTQRLKMMRWISGWR